MPESRTPKPRRAVERAVDTRMVRIRPGEVVDRMHPEPGVTVDRDWRSIPRAAADRLVAAAGSQVEVRTEPKETEPEEEK